MSEERYDAVVIGSGQGGGPLAGAFSRAGWKAALVEQAQVGGSCVNHGCTPTKTMIASARVAHLARRGDEYGVSAGPVSVRMADVVRRKREVVASFRVGSEKGLESAGVELVRGRARLLGAGRVEVRPAQGPPRTLSTERIFINTGARPAVPQVQGLDEVPWLDSTSVMDLDEVPSHLLVLGGGYVGLEFAQMYRRFGSRVSVVERGSQLLDGEDEDVAAALAELLEEDGIGVHLNTEVRRVSRTDGERVTLEVGREGAEITGSHLLAAVGRQPNTAELGLEAAGVETDEGGHVVVNERLETSVPGIWALGDAKPGPAFTHVSYDDYRVIRENLLGEGRATISGRLLAYTVFTDPQLGRVGMSEREAEARAIPYRVARMPAGRAARAIETGETRGLWKALVDPASGQILGAAVLAVEGGEIASMLQIAMMGGVPYTELRDGMFSHPTFAESLNNLFAGLG